LIRSTTLIASALLLSLPVLRASAEANANAPRIRIVAERDVDPKMESKHGRKRAEKLAGRSIQSLEFVGADGKVKKTIDLTQGTARLPEGVVELREAKVAKTGRRVAVERRRHDTKERNPYKLRGGEHVEVVWYDEAGGRLGSRSFKGAASIRGVSDDGSMTILVDQGFDPEGFEGYHDVPGLKTTETLKQDPELVDHFVYAVRPSGEIVVTRRIAGPIAPPDTVRISPSGKWFVYAVGSRRSYINNVETGSEELFESDMSGWDITDKGELFGWKLEGDKGRYEKVNGELVWKAGKRVFRKFVRQPGESSMKPTEEVKDK